MRIALIAPEIPDYSLEFANIVASSAEVLLCIADKHFSSSRPQSKGRLQIEWLPWPRQSDFRNIFFIVGLARRIRSWQPDIVHFMNESNIWLNLLVPLLGDIPVLTTVHDVRIHPGDYASLRVPRIFTKMLVRQSDAIIVHGHTLRTDAIKTLPVDPRRVLTVAHPPLTDYARLAAEGGFKKPADGIFRILFFGRIYEYKGLRYLLEAMSLVHSDMPHVRLVIAGAGENLSAYLAQIKDTSFLEIHHRFIPAVEAAKMFAECDLLALPYIEASQSGVLNIAMGFGLPVLATDVGEVSHLVRSMKLGVVVPPRDAYALASAIQTIASDQALQKELSENAAKALASDYAPEALSSQALRAYSTIMELSARRPYSNGPSRV